MRWRRSRRSANVEDRRGGMARAGLPIPGIRIGRGRGGRAGGIGILGLLVVLGLSFALGIDPMLLLGGGGQPPVPVPQRAGPPPADDERAAFVAAVLGDTEDTWHALFRDMGRAYEEPTLVLFEGGVSSACGYAGSAVGPFYCPADRRVYLDLGFFDELSRRFGAPGDFAAAYVIAHEVGHHVQTLLGIAREVREARARADTRTANALSVRQELQADCFAGVWAHHAERLRDLLEEGDIEEGIRAAEAVGDDTLQRRSGGAVVPDAFTHGSAEQRVRWFLEGWKSGEPAACDTFRAPQL